MTRTTTSTPVLDRYPREESFTACFFTHSICDPYPGGPIRVQVPLTEPPLPAILGGKEGNRMRSQGQVGLFRARGDVVRDYLVVVCKYNSLHTAKSLAESSLRLHEPDSRYEIYWGNPCRVYAGWRGPPKLNIDIASKCFSPLWEEFGEPGGRGQWLAARLMPRRVPAALRWVDPTLFHLFFRL